jgi:L-fuculose-phosphate aldolase
MSVADAAIKATLAQALRMLTRAEIVDYSGHASARRTSDSFYVNSGASIRGTSTESDIVAIDGSGTLLEGEARPPLEFHIHAAIYRARPDVHAVVHAHPKWSTYLSMAGVAYRPVFGQGALLGAVPVISSPLSVNTAAAGERVAEVLGGGRAVLLRSHGAVVVVPDLVECFAMAVYLEENAHRQYMALQIGTPYVLTDEEQDVCRRSLGQPGLFRKAWDHHAAQL